MDVCLVAEQEFATTRWIFHMQVVLTHAVVISRFALCDECLQPVQRHGDILIELLIGAVAPPTVGNENFMHAVQLQELHTLPNPLEVLVSRQWPRSNLHVFLPRNIFGALARKYCAL